MVILIKCTHKIRNNGNFCEIDHKIVTSGCFYVLFCKKLTEKTEKLNLYGEKIMRGILDIKKAPHGAIF